MHRHEVNGLRGDLLRRHGEVALIFAILIIHDDDHLTRSYIGNRFFDCSNAHCRILAVRKGLSNSHIDLFSLMHGKLTTLQNVFRHDIRFQIHGVTDFQTRKQSVLESIGDDGHDECVICTVYNC